MGKQKQQEAWKDTKTIDANIETGHASAGILTLWKHRSLLWAFVQRDIKQRYTGGSLGFFWTVITPLLELITYTFVFHGLLGVQFQAQSGWTNYALFLFSGMVTWLALSDSLSQATVSLTNQAHLIRKINFPKMILPTHVVLSAMVNQSIRFGVLLFGSFLLTGTLSPYIILLPLVMIFQLSFGLGVALILSVSNVYFRDTNHWINALLLLWMFVTPVVYPASAYPKKYILLLQLNPMAHLVGVYREIILNHTLPHPHSILIIVVTSILSLLIGYSVFHHHQKKMVDVV